MVPGQPSFHSPFIIISPGWGAFRHPLTRDLVQGRRRPMKTLIDLPRPLLLRAISLAAREQLPLSRLIAESLECRLPADSSSPPPPGPAPDPHYDQFRAELGL